MGSFISRRVSSVSRREADVGPVAETPDRSDAKGHEEHTYENVTLWDTVKWRHAGLGTARRKEKKNYNTTLVDEMVVDLQGMPWYHGWLTREVAESLLCTDGDFLVREAIIEDQRHLALSVRCKEHIKHIVLRHTQHGWHCKPKEFFPSVKVLVRHYEDTKDKVLRGWDGRLLRPVEYISCDLTSRDIRLEEKIGQVRALHQRCYTLLRIWGRNGDWVGGVQLRPGWDFTWNLRLYNISLEGTVNEGNFGEVYRAVLTNSGEEVAVKKCKVNIPDVHRRNLIGEGRLLRHYRHQNIVSFIGMCFYGSNIMIVMELVPGGSLLNYLREHQQMLTTPELTAMCRDTAEGMAYLESMNCVHRDLAARNCLLGENNLVKISDFGLSREVKDYYISQNPQDIPYKWTAPEALLLNKYSWMSDVWSYGVLMWEVFSGGIIPYAVHSPDQVLDMVLSGVRLPPPDGMPPAMVALMLRCWEEEPKQRPHFSEIQNKIEDFQALGEGP